MSLTFTPTSIAPISNGARSIFPPVYLLSPVAPSLHLRPTFQSPLRRLKPSIITASHFADSTADFDWGDIVDDGGIDEEDDGSPWEGAVVYKRSSSVSHLEYCTTLERLGLKKISSQLSRSTASAMGLRLTKSVKEFLDGTPVHLSVDVTRIKRGDVIRLDGILRTVIALGCNRCGEEAAESVFSNFSLLLTDEPVSQPEEANMGVVYGEDKISSSFEDEIGLDDRLYFPPSEREIDISKHIRDMVHLEITINAVCDPKCRGICLKCGVNLNTSSCKCKVEELGREDVSRPLGRLREQMQHK